MVVIDLKLLKFTSINLFKIHPESKARIFYFILD